MKIYTRTGDQGTTGLFGGERVPKPHPRIDAYGCVDETNSFIGMVRVYTGSEEKLLPLDTSLSQIQKDLFVLGADLATPLDAKVAVPRVQAQQITHLEHIIDQLDEDLPPLKHFILPGGSATAATLHVARTVCRRAERMVVQLADLEAINEHTAVYLNRLSDLLFTMARWANLQLGIDEAGWKAG